MRVGLAQKVVLLARRHPFLYRFRYALITEVGGCDFSASPSPAAGLSRAEAPSELLAAVSRMDLVGDGGFGDARAIAYDLSRGHRRGPGLGRSSTEALKRIYSGARAGVCSDYTQVFLGLCNAAGVSAREWGLCASFESPILGHAFAEVYSSPHLKWIFVDPLFSIFMVRQSDGAPLAATEIVDLVTSGHSEEIRVELIDGEGKPGWKRDLYITRYFDPGHAFFLLTNNDVFRQDAFLKWSQVVSTPILHTAMILANCYQRFHVYTNSRNRDEMTRRVDGLRRWRWRVLWAVALGLLGVAGAVALVLR